MKLMSYKSIYNSQVHTAESLLRKRYLAMLKSADEPFFAAFHGAYQHSFGTYDHKPKARLRFIPSRDDNGSHIDLWSYSTDVASYYTDSNAVYVKGRWSQTTQRHIDDFVNVFAKGHPDDMADVIAQWTKTDSYGDVLDIPKKLQYQVFDLIELGQGPAIEDLIASSDLYKYQMVQAFQIMFEMLAYPFYRYDGADTNWSELDDENARSIHPQSEKDECLIMKDITRNLRDKGMKHDLIAPDDLDAEYSSFNGFYHCDSLAFVDAEKLKRVWDVVDNVYREDTKIALS